MQKKFQRIVKELKNKSEFKVSKTEGKYIFGEIYIKHEYKNMQIARKFSICIKVKKDNSYSCFEINNEIPNEYHHHNVKNDKFLQMNSLCLASNAEIEIFTSKEKSINKFIEHFLIPYLFNFSCLEKYGICSWEGYSHGKDGIKEYYADKLRLNSEDQFNKAFELMFDNKLLFPCPCSSNKTFYECHYKLISEIPKKRLKNDAKIILGKTKSIKSRWSNKYGWILNR